MTAKYLEGPEADEFKERFPMTESNHDWCMASSPRADYGHICTRPARHAEKGLGSIHASHRSLHAPGARVDYWFE